jgi:uncharacterized membrane protein
MRIAIVQSTPLDFCGAIMAKTLSFAAIHMTVAFSVGYLMTGSAAVGGALALVEPLCNTVAYFFHEKLWDRLRGRKLVAVKA